MSKPIDPGAKRLDAVRDAPSAPSWFRAAALALAVVPFLTDCRDTPAGAGGGGKPDGDADTDTDTDTEEILADTTPWERQETAAPGSVTFTEILYHSPTDENLEWIELYNPMAIDMDVSGWSLSGGISYTFADGSIMPARGYYVVAADPSLLATQSGFADAFGPYTGSLSDTGERLDLYSNGGRLIDTVEYGDDDPWPVEADGSGLSVAKIQADAASDHAENWTASTEIGGTPGASNVLDPLEPATTVDLVDLGGTWSYDDSGDYPASAWADLAYDDSAWPTGQATFYAGAAQSNVLATVQVTADNYYGVYLGQADGTDLRLIGQDPDGNWMTVEGYDVEVTPQDHLYVAAWEAPSDYGGPQMTIAEADLPDSVVGTSASTFEWVLGPTDGCPGTTPPDPPPAEADLVSLITDANASGSWALPAVEAGRTSDPWGWAVEASFDDVTRYVWPDTFSDTSVTNTENTYALFRSLDPLISVGGTTELSHVPTTSTFRTSFDFSGDPALTELSLDCVLDDGAVFYLNGTEALRENMPAGAIDATTLASAAVTDTSEVYATLPSDALVRGRNVLAVEVHQAERDDTDMVFGCSLTARISSSTATPTIVLNEVAPAADSPYWVELRDVSESAQDTSGLVLASSAGDELVLPAGELAPDGLRTVDDVGFSVTPGDVLYLYSADRTSLLDAVRVEDRVRARDGDGGEWRFPSEPTPGETNVVETTDDIVINEVMYHRSPESLEGQPVTERSEEWIELYNRGSQAIDLGGWQIVDAVAWEFPRGTTLAPDAYLVVSNDAEALRAEYPAITIVGDFEGSLDNDSDRILLLDASGNPADEVRYYDGGRWPEAADGGGSSLELRDPSADNTSAEAWAASDESSRSEWVSYSYQGVAEASPVGPDGTWQEFVMGLLDTGEILIDDLSVIQDPDTAPVELIQNGSFDDADHWRLLGDHRHSEVVADPDDPSNSVLRLVATGPTEHMHNHAETTLLQPIGTREYKISFRARWISGSNQLNTRLYFNRLPHTTLVEQPALSGTPGEPNSTRVDDIGPTFADLKQDVAVPAPGQPVQITITAADPDGVAGLTLWSAVGGASFGSQAMTEDEPGHWSAWLDGQSAGTIVQFYIEAEDGLGVTSTFPAAGPDSRALIKFDDGLAATNGLHNFRLLMTDADSDWLLDDPNLMSNDLVGATVVYDESEVFYDVGARTKGSERGRPEALRLGYGVNFHSEQPFRGSHSSVLIDRSQGVTYGQREMLLNLVMTHAGLVSGEYNDLIQVMTPRAEHTGPAELQIDRFSNLVLASQFADGASGPLYDYELIYYPLTTDDGTAEGLKLPQPDSVIGTAITDLGSDKEAYRWNFTLQNTEREDDYDALITLADTFSLSGTDFLERAGDIIDVDQWLRAFAFATLAGAIDNYGGDGSEHNARFYVRPEDQRVLYFPHDLDFFGSSTMSVVGNSDLSRLIQDPVNRRTYYQYLQDIIERAYNTGYLGHWCDQIGGLLPDQDFGANCQFVDDRADWVLNGSSDSVMLQFPEIDFAITTQGGADFSTASSEVELEGEGWVDVRQIRLLGAEEPLEVTWIDAQTWQVTVPLVDGSNAITLVAEDLGGDEVGTDSIVVTYTDGA